MFVSFIVIHIFSSSFVSDFVLNTKRTKRKPNECIWWLRIGWLSFIHSTLFCERQNRNNTNEEAKTNKNAWHFSYALRVCLCKYDTTEWLAVKYISIHLEFKPEAPKKGCFNWMQTGDASAAAATSYSMFESRQPKLIWNSHSTAERNTIFTECTCLNISAFQYIWLWSCNLFSAGFWHGDKMSFMRTNACAWVSVCAWCVCVAITSIRQIQYACSV